MTTTAPTALQPSLQLLPEGVSSNRPLQGAAPVAQEPSQSPAALEDSGVVASSAWVSLFQPNLASVSTIPSNAEVRDVDFNVIQANDALPAPIDFTSYSAQMQRNSNPAPRTSRGDVALNATVPDAAPETPNVNQSRLISVVSTSFVARVPVTLAPLLPIVQSDIVPNTLVYETQSNAAASNQSQSAFPDPTSAATAALATAVLPRPAALGDLLSNAFVQDGQPSDSVVDQPQPSPQSLTSAAAAAAAAVAPTLLRSTAGGDTPLNDFLPSAVIPVENPDQTAPAPVNAEPSDLSAFAPLSSSIQMVSTHPALTAQGAKAELAETIIAAPGNFHGASAMERASGLDRVTLSLESAPSAGKESAPASGSPQQKTPYGDVAPKNEPEIHATPLATPLQPFMISRGGESERATIPSIVMRASSWDPASTSGAPDTPVPLDRLASLDPSIPTPIFSMGERVAPETSTDVSNDISTIGVPVAPDRTAGSQIGGNSQALNQTKNSNAVSATAFVTVASDPGALTQAVSIAVAAPKLNPNGVAAASATSNTNTSSDTPLSPSVLAHRAAESPELSAGMHAWNGGDNVQTRLVQSARLGGNLRESEMNVAMQTESLGAVELRARVSGDVVGAAIGVERHDAHAMISNDLSSLHQALQDRHLRVGNVSVFQGSLQNGATAGGDGKPSQQREAVPQRAVNPGWMPGPSPAETGPAETVESLAMSMIFDSNGRLSVRA